MKKLLSLLSVLFITVASFAQTTPFTFTTIANAQPDFTYTPGRAAENWIGQNTVNIPVAGTNTQRSDAFYRFAWNDLQSQSASGPGANMDFSKFDAQVQDAINKKQDFYFGIMINFNDHGISTGGATYVYPTGLHNAMQGESTKDLISGGTWYENTNSPSLLTWFRALNQQIANHIATATFNGVAYKNVVRRVDVRFMGDFGENIVLPSKTSLQAVNGVPTEAAIDSLIDMYRQVYPDMYLVNMIGTFSAGFPGSSGVGATPANSSAFALKIKNNKGLFGWRRDNWFRTDGYIHSLTNLNTNVAGGIRFDTAIMNRWKYGIVTGEPELDDPNFDDANAFITDVNASHANSVGNGNVSPGFNMTTALQNAFRAGSLAMGYRLLLTGGSSTTSPTPGGVMNITLNWQNVGLCPPYWAWNAVYELRTTAGTVAFTATSAFRPKGFMPSGTATVSNENFTLTGVAAGTYNLFLIVRDSTGYLAPMPLAITGRQTDGAYPLRQNIVIGGTSPVAANAGVDQTITLPTNSVNLDGTASTGVITSYSWTRVSGPNTPTIVTSTSATTSVTGLIAGTYVFQLSVNGGASTDNVSITVNPTPVQANAGPNQNITISSATVNGSASVGATTYLWTLISGPNTPTITTPTGVTTTITGLITGTYVFQLAVNGGTVSPLIDQINIVVAIPAVVANAGADQAIVPPASSVTVNGNLSTGPITTYSWTRVSGPNTPTITTPNAVSTTITGLITGTYVFQLSVNGGASTDNMTVTVSASPVASAGADQTITLPTNSVTVNGSGSTGATTFLWTRISGPNTPTITTPTTVSSTITGLIAGTYVFQLAINGGSTGTLIDQMTVIVNPAPAVANAGNNQTITLPTSTVTLNGSASTNATSFAWTRISGPNTPTITTPTTVTTTVTGLIAGTYVFQLAINGGSTGTLISQVTITVLPAIPPVANAGPDQTIVLPVTNTTLNGGASTGPVTSYTWTQVAGPITAVITTPTTVTTTITGLTLVGLYQFQLSVNGGASTDIVNINVNPVQTTFTILTTQTPGGALENDGPQGGNTGIELGVKFRSSVAGNIVGVRFYKQVGNTGTHIGELYSLTGTRLAQATFTGETASGWQTVTFAMPIAITAGTIYIASYFSPNGFYSSTTGGYTTAIVNGPLTGLANGTSGVNGLFRYTNAPIVPNAGFGASNYYIDPIMNTNVVVAHAGGDQTITLPIATIVLDGSTSTGQYNSVTWSQISGPNTATITSKANILTSVTGLIQGTYVFRLSLDGGASTDDVTVAVNPAPVPSPSFNMRLTKLVNQ